MNTSTRDLTLIRAILDKSEDAMPGQRFQDPKIQIRKDTKRPYYYIWASVPIYTQTGIKRERKRFPLGFCDETSMRQAKAAKQQIMAPINAGKFMLQSQITFGELMAS